MNSLYINRNLSPEKGLTEEMLSFLTLYLFTEHTSFSSYICQYVGLWKIRETWSDALIIELSYLFKYDEVKFTKEEFLQLYASIKKIRSLKHKDKQQLVTLAQFKNLVNNSKQLILFHFKDYLSKAGLLPWLDLFDNKTNTLLNFTPAENINPDEEDMLIPLLETAISESREILCLNDDVEQFLQPVYIEKENHAAATAPFFYTMPLFRFPLCITVSKETLKTLRTGMLDKMKPITNLLHEFRNNISKEEFDAAIEEKYSNFYRRLLPETAAMQSHINSETNFQQALNAMEKPIHLTLNLGITSVATLINYYEKSGTISAPVSATLKHGIAAKTGTGKNHVFLYWS